MLNNKICCLKVVFIFRAPIYVAIKHTLEKSALENNQLSLSIYGEHCVHDELSEYGLIISRVLSGEREGEGGKVFTNNPVM